MIGIVLWAAVGMQAPQDAALRAALDALYDGATESAQLRLAELQAAHADDPMAAYLLALALEWKLEQRPEVRDLDAALELQAGRALALAEARLAKDAEDARARLARGAAWGIRSRRALFRGERRLAARSAVRMREALTQGGAVASDPDALFGLGLYDYYADVLPRMLKLLRFVAGLPGGDRARGLASIEDVRGRTRFHDVEVEAQLHEIHASFEKRQDRALEVLRGLRERYPGSPLWGLKLAAQLRDRLGLYAQSVAVYREVEAASAAGHPHYAPVVAAMAGVGAGEALLLDLRLADARDALRAVLAGNALAPWIAPRAGYLLGRALEFAGDRADALPHYRNGALSPEPEIRRRAQRALKQPMAAREPQTARLLAEARRLHEAGRTGEAGPLYRAALASMPRNQEAQLRVAEAELAAGRLEAARAPLTRLARESDPEPPWVRPWSRVLLGELHDLAGERAAAVLEYNLVWEEPGGLPELRARAARGLQLAKRSAAAARQRPALP